MAGGPQGQGRTAPALDQGLTGGGSSALLQFGPPIHGSHIVGSCMRRPRVLLADDHRLLREAFVKLLEPTCDVVGTVGDGRALLAAAPELRPDIVVLDVAMPLLNGLDAARQLKRLMPAVKVIFLTVNEDPDLAS